MNVFSSSLRKASPRLQKSSVPTRRVDAPFLANSSAFSVYTNMYRHPVKGHVDASPKHALHTQTILHKYVVIAEFMYIPVKTLKPSPYICAYINQPSGSHWEWLGNDLRASKQSRLV